MSDTTIKKVQSSTSPVGKMGQKYLASGKNISMRLWDEATADRQKAATVRNYETVGYVISGRAELVIDGQNISLKPGDSWLVPAQAQHVYTILEPFTAVEATAPPGQVHDRDE